MGGFEQPPIIMELSSLQAYCLIDICQLFVNIDFNKSYSSSFMPFFHFFDAQKLVHDY